jgi:SAM-dependent methyltransferase
VGGDQQTLEFYTREAAAYADYASQEKRSALLDKLAAALPPGGSVLDFGCGSGWAGGLFRKNGFDVEGFDGSEGLAAEARTRYNIPVTVGRFEDLSETDRYDGIWASFCLLHDSREAMPGHLARLHRGLRPEGLIYIGLKEGVGQSRDSLGRLYTYFTVEEMRRLMTAAGFTGFDVQTEPSTGYDGASVNSMHIFAQRG